MSNHMVSCSIWNKFARVIFSESRNYTSHFGECGSNYFNFKLIPNWTRKTLWLLLKYHKHKIFAWKKCRKIFLEAIFPLPLKLFLKVSAQNFHYQFTWYHFSFSLVFQSIIIQNDDVSFALVTHFALMWHFLHLNCAAASQSESSKFLMYIIRKMIPWINVFWPLTGWGFGIEN